MSHFAREGMQWRRLASLATQLHNAASLRGNLPTYFVSFESGKLSTDSQRGKKKKSFAFQHHPPCHNVGYVMENRWFRKQCHLRSDPQ
jgi:hypothetical protein